MFKPSARLFPIGTVLEGETSDYNPNNYYVDGVWEQTQQGTVSVGLDTTQTEFNTIGKTGGAKTHTLTVAEIPSHGHKGYIEYNKVQSGTSIGRIIDGSGAGTTDFNISAPSGGGQAHNNLQPYKTVYKWKLISYSN